MAKNLINLHSTLTNVFLALVCRQVGGKKPNGTQPPPLILESPVPSQANPRGQQPNRHSRGSNSDRRPHSRHGHWCIFKFAWLYILWNKDNIEFYTFNPWTPLGWKQMERSRKWPFLHNSRPPEQLRNNASNQNVNKLSQQQRAASESCSRSDHKLISHGFIFSQTFFGVLGTVAHCTRR